MAILSRSRSLRQPGYSHRELLPDVQQPANGTKNARNTQQVKALELQERSTSVEEVAKSLDDAEVPLVTENRVGERRNPQHAEGRSFVRRSTHESLQSQEFCSSGRRLSSQTGQRGGFRPGPGVGANLSSSGLPPRSQLSRSSSLRQPPGMSSSGDSVKRLHSRNASVAGTSTTTSGLRPGSTATRQEDRRDIGHSLPPPMPASTAGKPAVASRRKPSNASMQDTEFKKPTQDRLNPAARPQFSTYQQHFSPKKKQPATMPANASSSSSSSTTDINQISTLQDELLQLQWMYHFSHQRLQTWIEGRETMINQQRTKHLLEVRHVKNVEQSQQKCINAVALRDWLVAGKGQMSLERIESLAQCVRTLTDLAQPYGRLSQIVEQFEGWYEDTSDSLSERSNKGQVKSPKYLQSLGPRWSETVTMLIHSVKSCLQHLQDLSLSDTSSGLGLVLDGHIRLARGIFDELRTMEDIHAMALDQEENWINFRISALLSPDLESESSPSKSKHYAAWEHVTWPAEYLKYPFNIPDLGAALFDGPRHT